MRYGIERVEAAFRSLGTAGPPALAAALYQEGESIMARSKETYCPVDTGTLRDSGFVSPPVDLSVELGYGGAAAPYALAVHETPRAGHTGGRSPREQPYRHWAKVGEWKYLETPFKAAADGMADRLAVALGAAVSELGHG